MEAQPVRLVLTDDLQRKRAAVFFSLLLVIPHVLWLITWGIGAFFAAVANWVATLARGESPRPLHAFLSSYVRYITQVYAYLFLAADPYPPFDGRTGYPLEVSIPPPGPQRRWTVALRLLLALPALLLLASLSGGFSVGGGGAAYRASVGLLYTAAFLAWVAILARGAISRGLGAYAYLLLTESYPYAGPYTAAGSPPGAAAPEPAAAGEQP